ncbi:MAG: Gldg family protein [Treponema sp.]|nr:Gldg family protein [Candidatus Treponema equi]
MKKLFNRFLYRLTGSPITYIASYVFIAWLWIQWFIGQRFFAGAGNTDLHRFFAAFPLGSVFYLPLLVSIAGIKGQLDFPYPGVRIILAKILACLACCGGCLLLSTTIPLAIAIFGDVEFSQFLTGYLGMVLFFTTAVSFTVYVFTAIRNTAAAFITAALGLLVCNGIHNVPLYLESGTLFSCVIKTISFAWNFDQFSKGLLSLRHVLYFILFAGVFVFLSWHCVERLRGNCTTWFRKTTRLSLMTFALLAIVTVNVSFKLDVTKSKKFSTTSYTEKLAGKISEPVFITYYLSPQLKNLYPQVRDVKDYLEIYCSVSDLISLKVVSPDTKEIQDRLSQYGINGQPIRSNSISSSSVTNVYSAIVIDYLGMSEVIPFVLTATTLEFDLAQKIESLVEERKNLVQIVVGNNLSLENEYSYIIPYLKSLGYVPFVSELPSKASDENKSFINYRNVPLVLVGCERLDRMDCKALEKFILDGGRAFIASQPYSVDIANDWNISQSDDQLYFARTLFSLGIYCKPTLTCDISNFRITMTSNSDSSGNAAAEKNEFINYSLWPVLRPQKYAPDGMTTFWPCAFDIDNEVSAIENLATEPVLETSSVSWQMDKIDGKFITNPFVCPKAPEDYEEKGPFSMAAYVHEKDLDGNLRAVYFADQYAFSTPMISYSSGETMDFRAFDFLGNCLLLLNGQKDLLALKNKSVFNYSLYKISDQKLAWAVRKAFFISFVLPLVIIIGLGIYFKISRRKYRR